MTLALAIWTVLPAPNLPLLVLAVAVPELAPYGFVLALAVTFFALGSRRGRVRVPHGEVRGPHGRANVPGSRMRSAALALAVLADACFGWPLVAVPFADAAANHALAAAAIPPPAARPDDPVEVTRDLPVPLRGGGALALDLYRPRRSGRPGSCRPVSGRHDAGRLPLLVTIYGGAWIFGSRAGEAALARRYAAQGYAVAAIDYRHAPRHHFPAQIEDVEDALRALAAHAERWQLDPSRVALLGRSAGAQLALLATERPQPLQIRAVVAYYAPTDLVGGYLDPPRPDPADVRRILSAYLGGPPDAAHRAAYAAAAPLAHVRAGLPPALLVIGDRDELVRPEFQRAFAARLRAAGVRTVALELPWANHAFDEAGGLGANIAHAATLRFLTATLGPGG